MAFGPVNAYFLIRRSYPERGLLMSSLTSWASSPIS